MRAKPSGLPVLHPVRQRLYGASLGGEAVETTSWSKIMSACPLAARPAPAASRPSFTPGPWREHSHRQIGPDAGIVCEVWSAIGWGDAAIVEADANVHLIAAAPELYAALRTALVVVSGCNGDGLFDVEARAIRAALAKAEGRS